MHRVLITVSKVCFFYQIRFRLIFRFEKSFGFSRGDLHKKPLVYGNGIAPLFHSLSKYCAIEGYPIIFPQGAYGEFVACAGFVGADTLTFPTREEDSFKWTPRTLHKALENKIDVNKLIEWFILNYPYSSRKLQENPDFQYNIN